LQLEAIPEMDVMKAETEVSKRDQDLTVARSNLQLQESLMKNAVTKTLDPTLEEMPVVPTDRMPTTGAEATEPVLDLIDRALRNRPELLETDVDLENRQISRKAARNALLPSLSLVGFYGGTGLGGLVNPAFTGGTSNVPTDLPGTWQNTFNNSAPDYFVGLNLNLPFRNRVAKADQYRSELEYRQAGLRKEQLKKQIRIEVRNAQYALEQARARVASATKARNLAQRSFEITKKEQDLGAGSSYQTMTAQRDLSVAELDLVTAMTTYAKSKVELDRATGATLEHNGVLIQDAVSGKVTASTP
jgi:outer membrane protein TolC